MNIFTTLPEWQSYRSSLDEKKIGFVPTMGALHEGHFSLIRRSMEENSLTVVSIYLNPTQFDNPGDLENYPASWNEDVRMLENLGVHCLIAPRYNEIYPEGYRYRCTENRDSNILCGASRPGHFDGVMTIVLKLLNLVGPDKAYFGEKDYQQFKLIEGMARAFFLPCRIIPCPIIREEDGLAMSSRNGKLTLKDREKAPLLYKIILSASTSEQASSELEEAGFRVDYIIDLEDRRYAAAFLKDVRLIDNVPL